MGLRLHSRLVVLNVAAIAVVTLLLGYFVVGNVRTAFESEIGTQLANEARLARAYIDARPNVSDSPALVREIADALALRVTLIRPDGAVLADSANQVQESPSLLIQQPEIEEARRSGEGMSIRADANGTTTMYYVATLRDGNLLRLAAPLSTVDAVILAFRRQLLLTMLIAVGTTLVFGYMVYAFVSRPLRRMADVSQELAVGKLNTELPEVGDPDLAVVGSSLNAMARSLQRKMDELQDDKQRNEAIITAMSAGIVVFNSEARVVLSNPSIRRLLDMPWEPTGRMPMELVRVPAIGDAVRAALSGSDVPAVELTTSTGRVLLAKAAPVRAAAGRVELAVVVFHDLTEIRRTERMRKDFIANVSHEFKTPLTSIRGYAETLRDSIPGEAKVSHEFLEAIERNAALLQTLVEDLLVLARLESELPLEKEEVDVRALMEQLIQSRRHLLHEKQIHVEVKGENVRMHTDRFRLGRAIGNLLDNAIYYNPRGGRVGFVVRPASSGVAIEVTDTGAGIPQEHLSRIFERFYRVDKSRSRDGGGTGLGLAIARHAVESLGGTISVFSKVGAGSTFTVFVPNAADPVAAEPGPAGSSANT